MDKVEVNSDTKYPTYKIDANKSLAQGGIIKDFDVYSINGEGGIFSIKLQYVAIISQACDIEQFLKSRNGNNYNNYLPNIMILPMYIYDLFKLGDHLQNSYQIKQRHNFSDSELKLISQNQNPRYHFLKKDDKHIKHDLIMDFKHYFTIPEDLVINQHPTN